MKYAVWFVRLIYAAWMIPAGLNHFIRLYPQPIGNQPLTDALLAQDHYLLLADFADLDKIDVGTPMRMTFRINDSLAIEDMDLEDYH